MPADDPGNPQPQTDLKSYLKWIFRRPLSALAALAVLVIVAIGTGFGSWISQKSADIAQWGCEAIAACAATEKEDDKLWELVFSTAVPHCASGRLVTKLRDWSSPVKWQAGAERLVICADAKVTGAPPEIPALIEERFPACLRVVVSDDSVTVSTRLESTAVCRAPYRFNNGNLEPAGLPGGLFVCMPGSARSSAEASFEYDGVEIPECDSETLREYNFLD